MSGETHETVHLKAITKKKKKSKLLFCSSLIRVKQQQQKSTRTVICYMFPILSLFRG